MDKLFAIRSGDRSSSGGGRAAVTAANPQAAPEERQSQSGAEDDDGFPLPAGTTSAPSTKSVEDQTGLTFEVLDVLEFDNDRKRMSVVVRIPAEVPLPDYLFRSTPATSPVFSPTVATSSSGFLSTVPEQRGVSVDARAPGVLNRDIGKADFMLDTEMNGEEGADDHAPRPPGARSDPTLQHGAPAPPGHDPHPLRHQSYLRQSDRHHGDRLLLLSKGADNSMLDLGAGDQDSDSLEWLQDHVKDFSKKGLRTLLLGYRWLDSALYREWHLLYSEAKGAVVDGETKKKNIAKLVNQLEKQGAGLELIGCTGVEDRLQDEVPETIAALQTAGVKLWVLTGDKVETAIQIGQSCNLLNDGTYNLVMTENDPVEIEKKLQNFQIFLDAAQILKEAEEVEDLVWSEEESEEESGEEPGAQDASAREHLGGPLTDVKVAIARDDELAQQSRAAGSAGRITEETRAAPGGGVGVPGSPETPTGTPAPKRPAEASGLSSKRGSRFEGVVVVGAEYQYETPEQGGQASSRFLKVAGGEKPSRLHKASGHAEHAHMITVHDFERALKASSARQEEAMSRTGGALTPRFSPLKRYSGGGGDVVDPGASLPASEQASATGSVLLGGATVGGASSATASARLVPRGDRAENEGYSSAPAALEGSPDIRDRRGDRDEDTGVVDGGGPMAAVELQRAGSLDGGGGLELPWQPPMLRSSSSKNKLKPLLGRLPRRKSKREVMPLGEMQKKAQGRQSCFGTGKQRMKQELKKRYYSISAKMIYMSSEPSRDHHRDHPRSTGSAGRQQTGGEDSRGVGSSSSASVLWGTAGGEAAAKGGESGSLAEGGSAGASSTLGGGGGLRGSEAPAPSRAGDSGAISAVASHDFAAPEGDLLLDRPATPNEPASSSSRTPASNIVSPDHVLDSSFPAQDMNQKRARSPPLRHSTGDEDGPEEPSSPSREEVSATAYFSSSPGTRGSRSLVIDPDAEPDPGDDPDTTKIRQDQQRPSVTYAPDENLRERPYSADWTKRPSSDRDARGGRGASWSSLVPGTPGASHLPPNESQISIRSAASSSKLRSGTRSRRSLKDELLERDEVLRVYSACSITLTGDALAAIFAVGRLRRMFFQIALINCNVIIACRVSPSQKASIVEYARRYKYSEHNSMLAIGDGANDVGMILKAHVGVGIAGREGAQAAKSADFAVGQFRFLRKLLFVYGREAFRRNAFFVYYTMYKNVAFCMPSVFFSFVSRFSALDLYDTWLKQIFNTVYTFLPIVLFAIFDRVLPYYYLMRGPSLYRPKRYGMTSGAGSKVFWYWFWYGVYFACICSILPLVTFSASAFLAGSPPGYHIGILIFLIVISGCTLILFLHHTLIFIFTIPVMFGGTALFFLSWWLASEQNILGQSSQVYRTWHLLLGEWQFYLIWLLSVILAGLPHAVYMLRGVFLPDSVRIVRERAYLKVHDVLLLPSSSGGGSTVVVPHKHAGGMM